MHEYPRKIPRLRGRLPAKSHQGRNAEREKHPPHMALAWVRLARQSEAIETLVDTAREASSAMEGEPSGAENR